MNTTADPIYSLGSDFSDTGFCDLWTYYPDGETFAVVLPYASICKGESTNAAEEATFMLEGTMYFGLVFLLIVMIQSADPRRVDWYRLIAFYLVGTLGVPLSNEFGADAAGFNRFIGFGVLVHNMAETAIVAVIWRGTQQDKSSKGVRMLILYFWVMILIITFSPLHVLLWLSSFQGATLDFFLVTSFCTIAFKFKENGKYFWIAFAASLMHILTIQPLFLGMMLGWTLLSVPTVIFLTPTFMLYIWFASSDPRATLTLAQQKEALIKKDDNTIEEVLEVVTRIHSQSLAYQQQQANSMHNLNNNQNNNQNNNNGTADLGNWRSESRSGSGNKHVSGITHVQPKAVPPESPSGDGVLVGMKGPGGQPQMRMSLETASANAENSEAGNGNGNGNGHGTTLGTIKDGVEAGAGTGTGDDKKSKLKQMSLDEEEAIIHIIQKGLFNSSFIRNPEYCFKRALVIAILGALLDEIFLILSPCIIDTSFLCN